MKFSLWLLVLLAAPLHAQERALSLIKNGSLNSSIFLAGWQSNGKVVKGPDLMGGEGKSAQIEAGGILYQDFIQPPARGLHEFQLKFSFRVSRFDGNARIRLRSNENVGDIISLRPTEQGIEVFGAATASGWKNVLQKPLIAGKTYEVVIATMRLNQEARSYTVSIAQEGGAPLTSASIKSFHTTPNGSIPAETITFDTTTDNGLTVDGIEITDF